ncbi:hypothetical protein, partial [Pseudomonas sp. SIMBA_068]
GICVLTACNKQQTQVSNNHTNVSEHEQGDITLWPTLKNKVQKSAEIENTIAGYLKSMTLEQKVAQMIQPEIRDITVEDM